MEGEKRLMDAIMVTALSAVLVKFSPFSLNNSNSFRDNCNWNPQNDSVYLLESNVT